ncbi:multisubunit sodium/proton antiporter, MrpE subunit [Ectothiorhodosinus mongolicus]|uniref:Multisubunit sodium/proton antiporter, MrpE subunit n=1 Tax=Ectothiorhodosinus mongolicus TaxID=233100 RepID=A0A1R3W2Y5_9GAMM|nr:Na+/H+ antiporter subunit E [Ectothiorhodosinus mongolicus]ULX57412.1 Na+/H+ antiporter subunit E [Ectothiorhodosinus mongolicus]SIT72055.1 multisubunit sodium/proton antiporter, MrpE subunit [Ectothiorhodosinus mongolicus]
MSTPLAWNILLGLIWMGFTGSFTGTNLLIGMVLGYVVLAFALRSVPAFANYTRKVPKAIGFVGFFIWELILSNVKVAYDVLTPTHYMHPGVIAFPLEAKTDAEITIVANLISLTPGTLSLDVSSDRSVLYIHCMYLEDEEEVMRSLRYMEFRALEVLR